jgi:hypothetical protein
LPDIDYCSSKHYLNRLAEGSANVDGSGNFSFEVLRSALKTVYDLDLVNVLQEDLMSRYGDITNMEGFIAHKDSHWFAIRKINDKFWNLNSMEKRPSIISPFKLGSEIAGYQKNGCKFHRQYFGDVSIMISMSFPLYTHSYRYCLLRPTFITSMSTMYVQTSAATRVARVLVERR